MENTSVKTMWGDFLEAHLEHAFESAPKTTYFGDNEKDANELAILVKNGVKKATSHSLLGLQQQNEPLPKIGELTVVTNWEGEAQCIIRTTKVTLKPYFLINASYAEKEGEGDKSLTYWKKVHWDYYTRELAKFNRAPTDSMIVVCEEFDKVF
ncbi:ASCH domain-containing protein [Maribacter sp. X9]|uniref:ASCH domain-containing protein n=1 Tax=Maribacter sp. X9 TaxID=3402159 RepID=UPI003AF3C78C